MNSIVKNTLEGRTRKGKTAGLFNPRTVFLMIIIGIFSFSAYFVLAGFSDIFRKGKTGSEHALSRSAIGYAGLMHLLKEDDNYVGISRSPKLAYHDQDSLHIISLSHATTLKEVEALEIESPTLIVLPKWNTNAYPGHKGWVRKRNLPFSATLRKSNITQLLDPIIHSPSFTRSSSASERINVYATPGMGDGNKINFYNFEHLQSISDGQLVSVITTNSGTILAKIVDTETYILADPDFLNTYSVAKPDIAEFALDMLYMIEEQTSSTGFVFDLSLHGFQQSRNFIKLALTPPFLSVTLCLVAMLTLIAWQAFMRFGSPHIAGRDIALGKLSLIYNAANFIKRAGREYKMAPQYLALTKKLASEQLHLPKGLSEADVSERLDTYARHIGTDKTWSELEHEIEHPKDAAGLLATARTLFNWREEISRGRPTTPFTSIHIMSTQSKTKTGDENGH